MKKIKVCAWSILVLLMAYELETLGKEGKIDMIKSKTMPLIAKVEKSIKDISKVFE